MVGITLSGRLNAGADGSVNDDKMRLTATLDNGSVRLTAKPRLQPGLSVDRNGIVSTINADNLADALVVSDYDLSIRRSTQIAGRDADVELDIQNIQSDSAPRLTINTSHDKIGDIGITVAKRGNSHKNHDGECVAAADDVVKASVNLPVKDLTGLDDVSANLSYDLRSSDAVANVGYNTGDLRLNLRTRMNINNQDMDHRLSAQYNGIEGITVNADVNDKLSGKLAVHRDRMELRVPFSKQGVDINDASLRMAWSHDL